MVDKIVKRIADWKGRLLSYGGRLTLLKSCLASIPVYLMSVIKFPKWAIEAINSQMAHFFWNNQEGGGGEVPSSQLAHGFPEKGVWRLGSS